jgi:hypothetical protein
MTDEILILNYTVQRSNKIPQLALVRRKNYKTGIQSNVAQDNCHGTICNIKIELFHNND